MGFQIITFYEFKELEDLPRLREKLRSILAEHSIYGTIIIAGEGFNSTVCGRPEDIEEFIRTFESVFATKLNFKSSFHEARPFRRQKVRIKPEIVNLRRPVEISRGAGTHISSRDWNRLISDPETLVLDTRNDYEFKIGTFKNSLNPETGSFNELPEFVEKNLAHLKHRQIALFCTGGIRCEKFAPFLLEKGFEKVFQLEGGILRYLEEIPEAESLWQGECFVFDERISVDEKLEKGTGVDLSRGLKSD